MDLDLAALTQELREIGNDYTALMYRAAEFGFCAVFTPTEKDGEPALCFGVWTGVPLDRSPHGQERAAAALVYCSWNDG